MPQVNVIENTLEGLGGGRELATLVTGSTLALLNNGYDPGFPFQWTDYINNKSASVYLYTGSTLVTSSEDNLRLGWQFNGESQFLTIGSRSLAGMNEANDVTIMVAMSPHYSTSETSSIGRATWGFPFLSNPSYAYPSAPPGPLPAPALLAYTSSGDMITEYELSGSELVQTVTYRGRTDTAVPTVLAYAAPIYLSDQVLQVYTFRVKKTIFADSGSFRKNNITYGLEDEPPAGQSQNTASYEFKLFNRLNTTTFPTNFISFGNNNVQPFNPVTGIVPVNGTDTSIFSGSLAGLLIYSRSLSDAEVTENLKFLINKATNQFAAVQFPVNSLVPVVQPIPSSSVLNIWSGYGNPSQNYGQASGSWLNNLSGSTKFALISGSYRPWIGEPNLYQNVTTSFWMFNGTDNSLGLTSQSLAGMPAGTPASITGSAYTIQIAGLFPTASNRYALLGNPQYIAGADAIIRYDITGSGKMTLDLRAGVGGTVNRYHLDYISGSNQLITIAQTGTSLNVYQNLTQISASQNDATFFPIFANLNSYPKVEFGWNEDLDTDNFPGQLNSLLIYSRSLSDSELSASYNYFIG
jgi:hypothetical protein